MRELADLLAAEPAGRTVVLDLKSVVLVDGATLSWRGHLAMVGAEEKRRRVLAIAREQYEAFSGVSVLAMQDFGAQPGDLNSLGYSATCCRRVCSPGRVRAAKGQILNG